MSEVVHLTELDVIFGYYGDTSYKKALNLCILKGKQFISNYKYRNMRPSLYALLLKLKDYLQLEKCICIRNNTPQTFDVFEKLYEVLG